MDEENGFHVGQTYWAVSFGPRMTDDFVEEVGEWLKANIAAPYLVHPVRGKVWCSSEEDALMIMLAFDNV